MNRPERAAELQKGLLELEEALRSLPRRQGVNRRILHYGQRRGVPFKLPTTSGYGKPIRIRDRYATGKEDPLRMWETWEGLEKYCMLTRLAWNHVVNAALRDFLGLPPLTLDKLLCGWEQRKERLRNEAGTE